MEEIKRELIEKIEAARQHLASELATVRSGRANASLLDKILVETYGQRMPVSNVATIAVPDPRQLLVQPWDKSNTEAIERAIVNAGLGFGVTNEGDRIRLTLPPLSNERREELVKMVDRLAEDTKVSVRNARREAIEAMERLARAGGVSNDDKERFKKAYQLLVDGAMSQVEQVAGQKVDELRSI